jgi:putative phage-type endonuclease
MRKPDFIQTLNEDDVEAIYENVLETIYEYLQENALQMMMPTFHEDLFCYLYDEFIEVWMDAKLCHSDDSDLLEEWLDTMIDHYFELGISETPVRSRKTTLVVKYTASNVLLTKIDELQSIPQPAQRTPEWYTFRNSLITASNLSKVFGTESEQNSLIYSKCKTQEEYRGSTSTQSPLHWGQKYEPVSKSIYENMFATTVGEFGCIRHPQYSFIGASPDGINVCPNSERYGRMLEIKNIVNREMNGIPSKAYWIQMQVQMETCNLDECDFLETRFIEYPSEDAFYEDPEREYRGVILYFVKRISIGSFSQCVENDNAPHYVYMPLDIDLSKESVNSWIQKTQLELRRDWTLYETLYWYLEDYSCILVERNQLWFQMALPKIEQTWNIILKERVNGYEHRAPKKRTPTLGTTSMIFNVVQQDKNGQPATKSIPLWNLTNSVCLVKL